MDIIVLFTNISIAGRYASSLYEVSAEHGLTEQVIDNFDKMIQLVEIFDKTIKYLPTKIMIKIINNDLKNHLGFCAIFINFLKIVTQHRRLVILKNIYDIFLQINDRHHKRQKLTVKVTDHVDESMKIKIEKVLKDLFAKDLLISYEKDKNILGGIVIESNRLRIDANVAYNLRQLSHQLKGSN